ncbi:MAG: class I SAM-dependent methyltransferase [Pirellulaceae bacterium]|nr:class I SAM-dependent methyltransferase [Pirellulaceae bacterium]
MPLSRILEPEVMDTPTEAADYDAMDHSAVNRVFVDDLLREVRGCKFQVPGSEALSALDSERSTLDILDLGTGTAQIPIELCRRHESCRVMAADAAANMLEIAHYNLEIHGLTERIQLARVDAKALPFATAMFDVVMSNSIIHHIPEPLSVLREGVRVVRPGGLLFFRDLLRPGDQAELNHLVETHAAGATENQRRMFAESLHAALSLAEIRELVATLGFAESSVRQTTDRHWTWISQAAG